MEKIRAVIVDDEKHAVETLAWKVEKFYPEVQVEKKFTDSSEALEYLQNEKIDLLFLDIEMPGLNGFELLAALEQRLHFEVIFTTAYDEFGIKAIKAEALDYLLKPVQNPELKIALDKYKRKHDLKDKASIESNSTPTKIALATKESITFVAPEEIVLCTSESNYTMIYLLDGKKKLISKTLKEIEKLLSPHGFFRAHLSHVVNLRHVKEYVRADGGYLLLSDGKTLPVSKNRREELLKLI